MPKKSAVAANTRSTRKAISKNAAVASVQSRSKANNLTSTNPGTVTPAKPARS
jgi:hypothetical protein